MERERGEREERGEGQRVERRERERGERAGGTKEDGEDGRRGQYETGDEIHTPSEIPLFPLLSPLSPLSTSERKEFSMTEPISPQMVTTTFTLEGYEIVQYLGVVRGIVVRSRSLFGNLGASLQTLIGGNITLFTDLCEQTRREAFNIMIKHAAETGANAVVGVRYDATEIMSGVTEVLAYGTAVLVRAVNQ